MRPAVLAATLALAAPLSAGTLAGQIALTEKGGRPARDASDVVVWVEGAKSLILFNLENKQNSGTLYYQWKTTGIQLQPNEFRILTL